MGRRVFEQSAAARALYVQASGILGWDLAKVSFEGPDAELVKTGVCQPALYVHGLALLAAARESGVLPEVSQVLGLSLGELTACAAAGVFDFATGLRIVAERGRLMQVACESSSGGMAAIIGEERATVASLCDEFGIEAANFNAPGQIIVSGASEAVAAALVAAKARGIKKAIPLAVAGAYHSRLMEPARAAFEAFLAGIPFRAPSYTLYTNTTGAAIADPDAIRAALVRQVVSPVRWEECMRAAAAGGATGFWEFGPGGVLAGLARRTEKAWTVRSIGDWEDLPGNAPAPAGAA